jgi:hypothetical protein
LTPYNKFARGLSIPATPCENLPEGCQQPMAHLQEGCPNYTQRDNLNNTFEVDKFKVQKQKTINSYKKN